MAQIILYTKIKASVKTCFDLSRNIDFHQRSMAHSNEKAVAGKTSGLIELGESVTWEATHFGVKQQLTSKITAYDDPTYFVDEQVSGAFKSFRHEHRFQQQGEYTIMVDTFDFKSPLGIFGKLANIVILKKYMHRLLSTRNEILKNEAERIHK